MLKINNKICIHDKRIDLHRQECTMAMTTVQARQGIVEVSQLTNFSDDTSVC